MREESFQALRRTLGEEVKNGLSRQALSCHTTESCQQKGQVAPNVSLNDAGLDENKNGRICVKLANSYVAGDGFELQREMAIALT